MLDIAQGVFVLCGLDILGQSRNCWRRDLQLKARRAWKGEPKSGLWVGKTTMFGKAGSGISEDCWTKGLDFQEVKKSYFPLFLFSSTDSV